MAATPDCRASWEQPRSRCGAWSQRWDRTHAHFLLDTLPLRVPHARRALAKVALVRSHLVILELLGLVESLAKVLLAAQVLGRLRVLHVEGELREQVRPCLSWQAHLRAVRKLLGDLQRVLDDPRNHEIALVTGATGVAVDVSRARAVARLLHSGRAELLHHVHVAEELRLRDAPVVEEDRLAHALPTDEVAHLLRALRLRVGQDELVEQQLAPRRAGAVSHNGKHALPLPAQVANSRAHISPQPVVARLAVGASVGAVVLAENGRAQAVVRKERRAPLLICGMRLGRRLCASRSVSGAHSASARRRGARASRRSTERRQQPTPTQWHFGSCGAWRRRAGRCGCRPTWRSACGRSGTSRRRCRRRRGARAGHCSMQRRQQPTPTQRLSTSCGALRRRAGRCGCGPTWRSACGRSGTCCSSGRRQQHRAHGIRSCSWSRGRASACCAGEELVELLAAARDESAVGSDRLRRHRRGEERRERGHRRSDETAGFARVIAPSRAKPGPASPGFARLRAPSRARPTRDSACTESPRHLPGTRVRCAATRGCGTRKSRHHTYTHERRAAMHEPPGCARAESGRVAHLTPGSTRKKHP